MHHWLFSCRQIWYICRTRLVVMNNSWDVLHPIPDKVVVSLKKLEACSTLNVPYPAGIIPVMNALKCRTHSATRSGYSWPLINIIMRMHAFRRKWPTMHTVVQQRGAGSLQRSRFRENPTNFLTSFARWVCDSIFRTNRRSKGEFWLNRQTDTQNDYSNPRCAC